jgi:hypothetical protein
MIAIMRGLTGLGLGLLCLSAAVRADSLPPDVVHAISATLERNHVLTKAQSRCITYWFEEETAAYIEVAVREDHAHGCPGDPDTNPRMFNVRYEKLSHAVLKEDPVTTEFSRLR